MMAWWQWIELAAAYGVLVMVPVVLGLCLWTFLATIPVWKELNARESQRILARRAR